MSKNKLITTFALFLIVVVGAIFFNAKSRIDDRKIAVEITSYIKSKNGQSESFEKKVSTTNYLLLNKKAVQEYLSLKLEGGKKLDVVILNHLYVVDLVGLNSRLRQIIYDIVARCEKSKKRSHHSELSEEDHIRLKGVNILYVDAKKGSSSSRALLTKLLTKEGFPGKYNVADLLLKSAPKKRRAEQERLKKVLPKSDHYLLFRK